MSNPPDAPDTGELSAEGGYACPYCGLDTPHHHSPEDVIALRAMKIERVRFEEYVAIWINRQDVMQAMRYGAASFAYLLLERWPGNDWGYREYKSPMVELLWQFWQVATIELRKRVVQTELQGFIDDNKAIPKSDSGELERLLNELDAATSLETSRYAAIYDTGTLGKHASALVRKTTARKPVLDLFERLRKGAFRNGHHYAESILTPEVERLRNRIAELERSTSGA